MEITDFFKRIAILICSLFLFSTALVLIIHSQLGAGSWDVFHLGIANKSSLTLGQAGQLTGLIIIILGIALGEIPGIASILNMYFVGFFIDVIRNFNVIPVGTIWWQQFLMLFIGVYLCGWATYFYLGVGMGAGPRDSLMLGLIKKFNKEVWQIRIVIEGTVLFLGYLLGGLVGVGTIIMAMTIGFSIQHPYKLMKKNPVDIKHQTFVNVYDYYKGDFLKKAQKETS